MISKGQYFPLYLYEKISSEKQDLFTHSSLQSGYQQVDGITNETLTHFQNTYKNKICKADIFYYIYDVLHCENYRGQYKDNLSKQLPRIFLAKNYAIFTALSQAGRRLADLHLNYESALPYPVTFLGTLIHKGTDFVNARPEHFYARKMKFVKKEDRTRVIYNDFITIEISQSVPTYNYVVNGKSALEWVIKRQSVRQDKDSQIKNNANDWANKTMDNRGYPLELVQRVITVSLETMKIVAEISQLGEIETIALAEAILPVSHLL